MRMLGRILRPATEKPVACFFPRPCSRPLRPRRLCCWPLWAGADESCSPRTAHASRNQGIGQGLREQRQQQNTHTPKDQTTKGAEGKGNRVLLLKKLADSLLGDGIVMLVAL